MYVNSLYLGVNVQYQYVLRSEKGRAHLPEVPRDAITKRPLSSRAKRSSSGSLIVRLHRQSRLWHTSIRGETDRPEAFYRDPDIDSSSSYVVVCERRLPVATHVDSRLFRGFSSQHFRLGLFVRFKGNLAQPKAIRFEGGFEFHPPLRLWSAWLAPNPIRNPFPPGESGAPLKGDPTFIDCREKLIRAFPPLKASDTPSRSSTVLGKLECYSWHRSSICNI